MKKVGLKEDPHTLIKDIGVGKQQLVEIAKALAKDVKLFYIASAQKSADPAVRDLDFLHIRTSDPAGAGRRIFRVFILFARNWKTSRSFFCCNFYKR